MSRATFTGTAKPMFCAAALMAVLMPMISPRVLISGPPLLPKLIAASVWMKLSREMVRVADGHHPLADAQGVRIPEGGKGDVALGFDLDQRQVGGRVGAHHIGLEFRAVGELHDYRFGALDHMVVGQDVSCLVDDHPRTAAGPLLLPLRLLLGRLPVRSEEKVPERIAELVPAALMAPYHFGGFDVDHGRIDPLSDIGKIGHGDDRYRGGLLRWFRSEAHRRPGHLGQQNTDQDTDAGHGADAKKTLLSKTLEHDAPPQAGPSLRAVPAGSFNSILR